MMRSVWFSFFISMAISFAVGLLYATEVFDALVRHPYNFTYFQSNILSSCGLLGFSAAFDVAFLMSRLTPMWMCVMGCIGSTVAFLLLWSTTKGVGFYASHFWLMCFYSFLAGHSLSYLYQTALYVCLKNFSRSRWGKLIGALHVPFGLSPFLFTLIATNFVSSRNASLIFLIFVGSAALSSFAGIFALRIRKKSKSDVSILPPTTTDVRALTTDAFEYAPSDTGSNAGDTDEERDSDQSPIINSVGYREVSAPVREDRRTCSMDSSGRRWPSLREVIFTCEFQTILWIFTLGSGVMLTQLRNLELFIRSSDDGSNWEVSRCLIVFSVFSSIARIGSGALSDYCKNAVPRINFLLVGLLFYVVTGLFACVVVKSVVDIWVILSLSGGLSYGLLWTICPTILAERYGSKIFTCLWPVLLMFSVVCSIVVQTSYIAIGNSFVSMDYLCDKLCIQLDVIVSTVCCACALFLTCGFAIVN